MTLDPMPLLTTCIDLDWKSLISRPSTETQHREALVLQPPAVVLSPSATMRRNPVACQSRFPDGFGSDSARTSVEVVAASEVESSRRRVSGGMDRPRLPEKRKRAGIPGWDAGP